MAEKQKLFQEQLQEAKNTKDQVKEYESEITKLKEALEQSDENLNLKQKDLDELYKLLHERENQVKEANDYA